MKLGLATLLAVAFLGQSNVQGLMGCPPVNPYVYGACVEECSTNYDCHSGYHCCSNGCGHTCVRPVCQQPACDLWCPYGFKSGSDGCPVCECASRDVCEAIHCPPAQHCRAEGYKCPSHSCEPKPICKTCLDFDLLTCQPCPSGMIPKRDNYGCQTCECVDPCLGNKCEAGYRCVLTEVVCVKAPCDPVGVCQPSPAKCPAPMELAPSDCGTVCSRDEDCGGKHQQQQKCCATSCGNQCVQPVCPQVTCLPCPDGSVPMTDMYGCKTCQCYDPCRGHTCPVGHYCESQRVTCVAAPCHPVPVCKECAEYNCPVCPPNHLRRRDAKGCRTCECYNPCDAVRCGYDSVCQLSTQHCYYNHNCEPVALCKKVHRNGSPALISGAVWIMMITAFSIFL